MVLDLVREWRAPFKPSEPVKDYAEVLEKYGIGWVTGDRYAGEWPRERFSDHGIGYEPSGRPKSDIYRELLPLINGGQAELLDLPRLFAQLVALDRRTARGGRDTIDMNRRRQGDSVTHDDVANAAAGALVIAGEGLASSPSEPKDDAPLTWREGLQSEIEKRRVKRDRPPQAGDSEWGAPHEALTTPFDPLRSARYCAGLARQRRNGRTAAVVQHVVLGVVYRV